MAAKNRTIRRGVLPALSALGVVVVLGVMIKDVLAAISVTPASGGATNFFQHGRRHYTTLTGPIIAESSVGQVGTGTIVLSAPAGFVFNTAASVNVLVNGGGFGSNINNVPNNGTIAATKTTTTLSVTITSKSSGFNNQNTLTWQNVQVRPTTGTVWHYGEHHQHRHGLGAAYWCHELRQADGSRAARPFRRERRLAANRRHAVQHHHHRAGREQQHADVVHGTIHMTTTAGTIAPTTSGAFVAGVRTQSVTVTGVGSGKTITVTDHGGSGKTGTSAPFTVNVGPLDHFAIASIGTQVAGTSFNVTITAQDAGNNTVTGFNTTAALSSGDGDLTPTTSGSFSNASAPSQSR